MLPPVVIKSVTGQKVQPVHGISLVILSIGAIGGKQNVGLFATLLKKLTCLFFNGRGAGVFELAPQKCTIMI